MAKAQRAVLLIIALLFLGTSVGYGALVVWQIQQDNKRDNQVADAQKADQSSQNQQDSADSTNTNKSEGKKMENFTPVAQVTELQKIDLVEGTGAVVQAGATVKAHYVGALAKDGTIFQASRDFGNDPISFSLSGVIKGWTDGIPGMKVGGKRRLIIPAAQAYGDKAQGNIPANSDLVFDVEIFEAQ